MALGYGDFDPLGTSLLGKRDFRPDGSYVTTKFFCFLLPLFPIRTLRVIPDPKNTWASRTKYYNILEKRRPHLGQTLLVYLGTAVFAALMYLDIGVVEPWMVENVPWFTQQWQHVCLFIVIVAPLGLFIRLLHWNAQQKLRAQVAESQAALGRIDTDLSRK